MVREASRRFLSKVSGSRSPIFTVRVGVSEIAHRLGRSPSVVSRELHRRANDAGRQLPFEVHRGSSGRQGRYHRRRIDTDDR